MRWLGMMQTVLFVALISVMGVMAAANVRGFHKPAQVDVVTGGLAKAFETHYDEVFPVKQLGVNLWAALDYTVFGEGRPGVVIGTEGWFYTDEEFKVADSSEADIRANLAFIAKVGRQLQGEGVALVVAVVPAKARIYSEFLAGRQPAAAYELLYERVLGKLTSESIPHADLRGVLTDGKLRDPTYLRTDTHWTPWGAHLAAAEIASVVKRAGLAAPDRTAFVTREDKMAAHEGDLLSFLPLAPYFAGLLPPPETIPVMRTEAEGVFSPAGAADLFGDTQLPRVALVGTSYSANALWNFGGALRAALGEDIASYAKEGTGPFRPMTLYLRSEDFRQKPPRLVIWEIPERSLISVATGALP